jgi:hypothetical protein
MVDETLKHTCAGCQGIQLYVDLRQPAGKPEFHGISGILDLQPERLEWMVSQLAFAGAYRRKRCLS